MAKIAKPLTNTEADRLKAKEKDIERYDGNGLILYVRVMGAKIWRFRYMRPFTKKKTKLNIGYYPQISISQARAIAEEYNGLLARNIDPQHHRAKVEDEDRARNFNTFQAVAENWHAKKQGETTETTRQRYWRTLELYALPYLGRYPITEIAPLLCEPFLREIESKGNIMTVKKICRLINEVLNFAVNGGLIPFNPCLKMSEVYKKAETKNNPHIEPCELPDLLHAVQLTTQEDCTKKAFYFQLLTMTRPNETTRARWEEIDLSARLWTIPAERMKSRKKHVIPLSTQAVALLEELRGARVVYEYVFTSPRNNSKPVSKNVINLTLQRAGFQGKQTAHGLRGLARTFLGEQGEQYEHAEACLSHKTGSAVSQAYNHATYLAQRQAIMQRWGDFVEACDNKAREM